MAQPASLSNAAVKHFVTIEQLSLHNAPRQSAQEVAPPVSPLWDIRVALPPATSAFILFTLLFSCAIGIQILKGIQGIKNFFVAVVIALVVASIPIILDYVHTGARQQIKAGPQEIPKSVSVESLTNQSARVVWYTDIETSGGLRYANAPFSLETSHVRIADNAQKTKTHTAILDDLEVNQTYELEVLSGTNWYRAGDTYIRFRFAP